MECRGIVAGPWWSREMTVIPHMRAGGVADPVPTARATLTAGLSMRPYPPSPMRVYTPTDEVVPESAAVRHKRREAASEQHHAQTSQ